MECWLRHGNINSYEVSYTTATGSDVTTVIVNGTGNNERIFTAVGLQPRTTYNFQVRAINSALRNSFSTPAVIQNTTLVPSGKSSSYL
jgi:hypothetical protein